MARPIKQGLDYFPMDTNFDSEVKLLIADKGIKALGVWVILLQLIYSENGYYIKNDKKLLLRLKLETMLEIEEIEQILDATLELDLFDKDKYEKYQIFTSRGIQNRYFLAAKKKKIVSVNKNYLCEGVSVAENTIYSEVYSCENPLKESKVKESKYKSKGKESKEEVCRVDIDLRDNNAIGDNKVPTAQSCKNTSEPVDGKNPPVVVIRLNGQQKEFPVTQQMIDAWQKDFPLVDVLAEIRKMRAWSEANPGKRKTIKGVKRFIVNWLSRQQDNSNQSHQGGAAVNSGYSRHPRITANQDAVRKFLEKQELLQEAM